MKKGKNRTREGLSGFTGMIVISIIALTMLLGFLVQGRSLRMKVEYYQAEVADLERNIEEEKKRTQEILDEEEYRKSDEYIESTAREKLGLVKSNEIVYKEEE